MADRGPVAFAGDLEIALRGGELRPGACQTGLRDRHVGRGRRADVEPDLGGSQFLLDQLDVALAQGRELARADDFHLGGDGFQEHLLRDLAKRLASRLKRLLGRLDRESRRSRIEKDEIQGRAYVSRVVRAVGTAAIAGSGGSHLSFGPPMARVGDEGEHRTLARERLRDVRVGRAKKRPVLLQQVRVS